MKKLVGFALCFGALGAFCLSADAQTQQAVRVRCGGPGYTDSSGQLWQSDFGYNTGSVYTTGDTISGTPDPKLYQDERYNATSSPLVYTFPLANGLYHVNLLFAEIYPPLQVVGARVFNVKIQGNPVFPKLDIFAAAGADTALVKGIDVTVQNGVLKIELDNLVQNAKIDGIEILPLPPQAPQLNMRFTYPDGTPVSGTLAYKISSTLLTFQGSLPLSNGQAVGTLLSSPGSLGLSGQYQVNLSLTDTAGHVLWQFTLGMNPSQINLGAIQSSAINVTVQKM